MLSWNPSCHPGVTDYGVYEGALGSFGSHDPLVCSTGGTSGATVTTSAGDRYFLVVPQSASLEGGYGATRAPSGSACKPAGGSAPACP